MRKRACSLVLFLVFATSYGCGAAANRRNDGATADRQSIVHDGRDRTFVVRVPQAAAQTHGRMPLVIVLHGGGGNAFNAEAVTGFTEKAHSVGFVAAYPNGTGRRRDVLLTWNAGHCCGYAMEQRVDDVGFIDRLIDELLAKYPIDPRRVYVTGMSNGAMMAHRIGIELSTKIAAIGPVVGTVFGDEARPGSVVSAIMINGMLDDAVPFEGGPPGGRMRGTWDGTATKPAVEQARFWAVSNGCVLAPNVTDHGGYVLTRYDCPSQLGVALYAVKDNGHAWPGGEKGSRAGDTPSRALDATQVVWEFFEAHPKP